MACNQSLRVSIPINHILFRFYKLHGMKSGCLRATKSNDRESKHGMTEQRKCIKLVENI